MFSAVLYGTGVKKSRVIPVVTYPWIDDPNITGAGIWIPQDIDLRRWFPAGSYSVSESQINGTSFDLPRCLRIYVSLDQTSSVTNRAIASRFDIHWKGNIVVTTHGMKHPASIINIRKEDLTVIDVFVSQLVSHLRELFLPHY